MEITIDVPDVLVRQTEAYAVARGVTLQRVFAEALMAQLPRDALEYGGSDADPPWMAGFGGLSDLGEEHQRIRHAIEDEFEGLALENPR